MGKNNKSNITQKEHYVPRFYLRSFTDNNGKLCIYDIKKQEFNTVKPERICYRKDLYETKWKDENLQLKDYVLRNDIEKIFSEYERKYATLLSAISKRCVPAQNPNALILCGKERNIFRSFVVNLILRNPLNMESLELSKIPNDDFIEELMTSLHRLPEDMKLGGAESVYIAAQKKVMLTEELEGSFPLLCADKLKKLKFIFLYARDGEFITSNVPVCLGNDQSIVGDNKMCLYLALTPKVAVLFGNYKESKKNHMAIVDNEIVDAFNMQMIKHGPEIKFIIGSSEELIRKYEMGEIFVS